MMRRINGYEDYAVTENGEVWSYKRKKFLKQRENNSGYMLVNLSKNGEAKTFLVHRLVLMTFCPVDDMNNKEASHKDENRYNNTLSNLEWIDHVDNCNMPLYKTRVGSNKSRKRRAVMCVETGEIYKNCMEAERLTGVFHNLIYRVLKGERNTAGGLHWVEAA